MVEVPTAFDRRASPLAALLLLQIWPDILSRRALPPGRLVGLGARRDFHHGLLWLAAFQNTEPFEIHAPLFFCDLVCNGEPQQEQCMGSADEDQLGGRRSRDR